MWLPMILLYISLLMIITFSLGRYRALLSVVNHFSEKEFEERFPDDYKFIRFIERIDIFEKIAKN